MRFVIAATTQRSVQSVESAVPVFRLLYEKVRRVFSGTSGNSPVLAEVEPVSVGDGVRSAEPTTRNHLSHRPARKFELPTRTFQNTMQIPHVSSRCVSERTDRSFVQMPLIARLMILLLVAGCSSVASDTPDDSGAPAAASGPPPALVKTQQVRRERIAPKLVAVGTVRPRHVSIIASAADGVVEEFSQEQGHFVKEGTVLSKLRMFSTELALEEQKAVLAERAAEYQEILEPRKEDVEESRAQHLAAEAAFANADRRLKELRSLSSRGAANPSAVDDAQDLFQEARQRLLAAKAVFERVSAGARQEEKQQVNARFNAQKKHVAWLEAEKEKRITRAPFDGFIVKEQTYLGQWLSKGDPVVTMAMLDEVDVEAAVDQSFVSQVLIGASVHLKIAGTPDPATEDGRWIGKVHSIVPRTQWESGSRSFPVIVRIRNPMTGTPEVPVPMLREGMMAEVEFSGSPVDAILVPKDSLVRTSRGTFVFALNPAEGDQPLSVRQVSVMPGISKEGWIQVSESDLVAGDSVVTEGAERLRPFQAVRVMTEASTE